MSGQMPQEWAQPPGVVQYRVAQNSQQPFGQIPLNPGPTIVLPPGRAHGATDGWNNNNFGYTNNTRNGPGRHSGETDTDRHCRRTTHDGKHMKCSRCFHYISVNKGFCANCGRPMQSSGR